MANEYRPLARNTNVVTQEVDGELLVYDMGTNKAVGLNSTAATVWRAADGIRTVSEIGAMLGLEGRRGEAEDLVWLALELLEKEGLVEPWSTPEAGSMKRISRRELGMRLGVAALLLLPIASVLSVPTSAQTGSVPLACQSCIDNSGATNNCGVCATISGTCYNNNGCSNGGATAILTCDDCVTYSFAGPQANNTWKWVAP